MMPELSLPPRVAIVGAGVAGAACAAGLRSAGFDVTVFDGSLRRAGNGLAARRAADGLVCSAEFEHGGSPFTVSRPRFRRVIDAAERLGTVARWRQRVYAAFPAPRFRDVVVPTPDLPAFCRALLKDAPLRLGRTVTGLQRRIDGWHLQSTGDGVDDVRDSLVEGPFEQVVLALPPPRAARLLTGHHDGWAAALAAVRMSPCWTLMAVTDELDWPWDAAEPERGALAWIERSDRKPGRSAALAALHGGAAHWVAHATPAWSHAHLDDDEASVARALLVALGRLLTSGPTPHWHRAGVHRWLNAPFSHPASDGLDCWWNARLRLAVCGGSFGVGSVEAAWSSGDELADAIAASFDAAPKPDPTPERACRPEMADPVH